MHGVCNHIAKKQKQRKKPIVSAGALDERQRPNADD